MFKAMLIKEFLLVSRDKHALAALFVMPAVFILIMSLALKDVFNEEKALIEYAVVDRDNSLESLSVVSKLRANKVLKEHKISADFKTPKEEGVQFIVVIPKGFKSQFSNDADTAASLQIEVASDIAQTHLMLFKTQVISAFMQVQLDALNLAQEMQQGVRGQGAEIKKMAFDEAKMMKIHYAALAEDEKPTSTQQSVPSWIVFSLFFVIIPMSTIFISERKQNTLMRLSTMNVSLPVLFGGKIIPYMVINQLQVWVMIAVGIFIVPLFGAAPLNIGGSLSGLIAISMALSLSAIGLSILIATLVDSVEQATTIGGIINILLGAIGGVMVPKFVMPEFMQEFANVSPMSWGLEGFLDIFLRRGGISDVLSEVLALSLFGLVSLLLAALIFNYKIRRVA
ncbi:ABC transporter permease [Sulfurimonas sp. HSL3-7]|uniref:ABC transporter permease n=1 Tax=Sulfonitrofixus jiaomeiensis TaxID=3131938 RepID=UPI0031F907FC